MGTFEPYQDQFPVAAAVLRSRGEDTPAARLGSIVGSDPRRMAMRRISALDALPAYAMASRDADCLQPIAAAASPPTGRAWFEVCGDLPGTGYGALCHSPEPGLLHIEPVELDGDRLRAMPVFGVRGPGGHEPLDRAALRRLARQALVSTTEGRSRMDAWVAQFLHFSPYAGTPEVPDDFEQRACLLLLTDLIIATMLDAGVITPLATVLLG